jgi:predicted nucleic acid-binding protein
MTIERALIDSGFIYGIFDRDDLYHQNTRNILESGQMSLISPDVVLGEVIYLLNSRIAIQAAKIPLEPISSMDLLRIREIMSTYADNRFDFVDCCIMALAESLNITKIYTFDRRDFQVFRPRHCDYLELLP